MRRASVVIAVVYFTVMTLLLTLPLIGPFNTIRPFIFGVPFVLAWFVTWCLGSIAVFYLLHRSHAS